MPIDLEFLDRGLTFLRVDPVRRRRLAEACQTEDEARAWIQLLTPLRHRDPGPDRWLENFLDKVSRQSTFSMDQWSQALVEIFRFLGLRQGWASSEDIVGYLWCCEEGARLDGRLFAETVAEWLDQEGFEALRVIR